MTLTGSERAVRMEKDHQSSGQTLVVRDYQGAVTSPTPAGQKSYLVKIYPAGLGSGLLEIPQQRFVIGRGTDCDLSLNDSAISRNHAAIEFTDGAYWLNDLNSTNGTHVNDMLCHRQRLKTGDLVRLGSHIMKFLASDHVETQFHETIYNMMVTDALTGTYTRRLFLEALERDLIRCGRHGRLLALALIDIDRFKSINDTHGHLIGDDVLRELVKRIRSKTRKDELFARFGGEEFAVLLNEATLEDACRSGERLRSVVADEPFFVGGMEIPVTISVGIAATTGEISSKEQLIDLADQKLFEAKRNGRNRVEW